MIVKVVDGIALMDCSALFKHYEETIAKATIRARCAVITVDEHTGIQLFDFAQAVEALQDVRPRKRHRRRPRKSEAA
jgi:hypothetical protein